jgi:hypothetical protein
LSIFLSSVFAATLDTLSITTTKTTVHPDENVTINFNMGQELGAYTFEVDFDDNLFEYVSTTGATGSATGDKATAVFYDTTGGSNPSSGFSMTFKAKDDITTSNPTQFSITATGLANPTGSETFDDIAVPITKDIMVEPNYGEYKIEIEHTGTIKKEEEKDIDVKVKANQGRYYEHLRLVAVVTKPEGATMQLLGIDNEELEHDVILNGWGAQEGFGLGGDVDETYHFRGIFSENGKYTLTLKLIDRDDSDKVITSSTKEFVVGEEVTEEELPEEYPKTGANLYVVAGSVLVIIGLGYVIINKK